VRLVASSTNICKCYANTLVLSAIAALTHLGGTLVQSLKTSTGSDLANISWGYRIGSQPGFMIGYLSKTH